MSELEAIGQLKSEAEKLSLVPNFHHWIGIHSESSGLKAMTAEEFEAAGGVQKLTGKGLSIILPEPFFTISLEVLSPKDESSAPAVDVELDLLKEEEMIQLGEYERDDENGISRFQVNRFVTGLAIKDGSGTFSFADKVRGLIVKGWPIKDLKNIEATIRRADGIADRLAAEVQAAQDQIEEEKNELHEKQQAFQKEMNDGRTVLKAEKEQHQTKLSEIGEKVKAQSEELAQTTGNLKSVQQELAKAEGELKAATLAVESKTQSLSEVSKRLDDLDDRLEQKESEIKTKTGQVNQLQQDLSALQADKSLFTDDMIGFARQGTSQVNLYTFAVILPLVALAAGAALMGILNSIELFRIYIDKPNLGVGNLLLAKGPLVMAIAAFLGFAYKVAKIFVDRIIEIHARRLRLSEITILSQKVSDAVGEELELDVKERTDLALSTRLGLVREYLSGAFDAHRKTKEVPPVIAAGSVDGSSKSKAPKVAPAST